jgi:hypothetical protein
MDAACLSDRLPNAEEIALAIPEPGASFAHTSLGRVISFDFRDPIDGLDTGQIVFFEHDSAAPQLVKRRLDVIDFPGHLRMTAGPFFDRLKAELARIEGSRRAGASARYDQPQAQGNKYGAGNAIKNCTCFRLGVQPLSDRA